MRVIVIGGSKGIGKAIADRCDKDGHKVYRAARVYEGIRNPEHGVPFDLEWPAVTIRDQMHWMIDSLGGLDWLVVSAGMSAYHAPWADTWEKAVRMMTVNYLGRITAYRAARKELLRSAGSALFISSSVVAHGAKGLSLYAGSLGAIEGWARSEHQLVKRSGARVNVLSPGWTNTDMTECMRPDYREAAARWMPNGRFLEPDEVASKSIEILQSSLGGEVIEYLGECDG